MISCLFVVFKNKKPVSIISSSRTMQRVLCMVPDIHVTYFVAILTFFLCTVDLLGFLLLVLVLLEELFLAFCDAPYED